MESLVVLCVIAVSGWVGLVVYCYWWVRMANKKPLAKPPVKAGKAWVNVLDVEPKENTTHPGR